MQTIGEKIAALIKFRGVLKHSIAQAAGINRETLSRIIAGKSSSGDTLSSIATALGVKVEYLKDKSRPFYLGDEIPEDALVSSKSAEQEKKSESQAEKDRLRIELLEYKVREQQEELRKLREEIAKRDPDSMKGAIDEIQQKLDKLLSSTR